MARNPALRPSSRLTLHPPALCRRLISCPASTLMRLIVAGTLALAGATGFAGCSGSENQGRRIELSAQQSELKAEQAEAAANRARAAAQQAQIAADRAQKAVDDATREINRVAEHLDQMNHAQNASD